MKKILYFVAIFALLQTQLFAVPLTIINDSDSNYTQNQSYTVNSFIHFTPDGAPCHYPTNTAIRFIVPAGGSITLSGNYIDTQSNTCLGNLANTGCGAPLDWWYLRIWSMIEDNTNTSMYAGIINLISNNCFIGNTVNPNHFPTGNYEINSNSSVHINYTTNVYEKFRINYNRYGDTIAILMFE